MASDEAGNGAHPRDAGRRALVKAATVASGAVAAATLLPESWRRPLATIGGLPAHAQTSLPIRLWNARALIQSLPPPATGEMEEAIIIASCNYSDSLGDFDPEDHLVTVTVTPFHRTGSADIECSTPTTYSLGAVSPTIVGNGTEGWLQFTVHTTCLPAGWITWHIHTGTHSSDPVKAEVNLSG